MLEVTSPYLSPYTNTWSVHGLDHGRARWKRRRNWPQWLVSQMNPAVGSN